MFSDFLTNPTYTCSQGTISKAPVRIPITRMPSQLEIQRLEYDLRQRFDAHQQKLVQLYILGEKYNIENLQNKATDAIQDGFCDFGTVFGPTLLMVIFSSTKKNSKLRDLVVATNVLHIGRGCKQLRAELMLTALMCPDFLPHMLKWISRNFAMFGRRATEGYSNCKQREGFSMLNRDKLCPCHFHKHTKGGAHKDHEKCAIPYLTCGHGDGEEDEPGLNIAEFLRQNPGNLDLA